MTGDFGAISKRSLHDLEAIIRKTKGTRHWAPARVAMKFAELRNSARRSTLMTMESLTESSGPSRRRRKEARPAEITAAALELFADHGFAAARLEDIASRAGVVKGSIYRYFPTKEELFRAVVRVAVVPNVEAVRDAAESFEGRFAELAPRLLAFAASVLSRPLVTRYARMVIGESRNFPDLARIWHDEVVSPVLGALTNVIAQAQARGEVRDGDPRTHAFSLVGPLFMGMLFRDVFKDASTDLPNLVRLAEQHGSTVLRGLLAAPPSLSQKEHEPCPRQAY